MLNRFPSAEHYDAPYFAFAQRILMRFPAGDPGVTGQAEWRH